MNKMLLFAILLIFTMSILILLKMPNFASYHFLPYSNSTTSGGYGPNQVSTIFGFGIAILGYSQIMKDYIFQYKIIDLIILALFIGLGLITFSRGGIFGVTIAFSFAVSYYIFQGQRNIQLIFKGMVLLAAVIVTWFYIVSITDGIISQRYGLSEASYGKKLIMDLTGRAEIYEMDMNIFYDHLFAGVGVGNGNKMRENYGYGKAVAAHTEYSRMLAEHGILGLFSLLMFLGISIYHLLLACSKKSKFIKILFGMLAILTLSHSAMRVAMPSFIYGFLFINYKD